MSGGRSACSTSVVTALCGLRTQSVVRILASLTGKSQSQVVKL